MCTFAVLLYVLLCHLVPELVVVFAQLLVPGLVVVPFCVFVPKLVSLIQIQILILLII